VISSGLRQCAGIHPIWAARDFEARHERLPSDRHGQGRRPALVFSKVGPYCAAHALCPVMTVPPSVLARGRFRPDQVNAAALAGYDTRTPEQLLAC
jgi:hypothetical protein